MCCDGLASVSAGGGRVHVTCLWNVIFAYKTSHPPSCCVLLIDMHTSSNVLTESPV